MAYVTNEEGYNEYQSDAEVMYHISDTYLGRKPLLTPRIPRVAKESGENIRTKRICVSPSIEQCVLGIDGVSYMESSSLEKLVCLSDHKKRETSPKGARF